MPLRCALSHDLPDRGFNERGRKCSGKTAFDLFNTRDFSPGPNILQGGSNVAKGWKRFAPGMQEDEIVVARFCQPAFRANPENASLYACELACGFRFGKVPIPSFVIFHASLSDERLTAHKRSHHIGEIVMGFILKRVTNGERCVLRDR